MQPSSPSPSPVPWRTRWWTKWVVFGIAAGIAFGFAFGLGVPALQNALRQPKMSLTDLTESNTLCRGPNYPPQYERFTFAVHNTGDGDGFATVSFIVLEDAAGRPFPNPEAFAKNRYFVPAQGTIGKDANVQLNDCYMSHTWNVVISAVEKA